MTGPVQGEHTAAGPVAPSAVTDPLARLDLCDFEQMLGGDTVRPIRQGAITFGRPLAYEIGLDVFPPAFRDLRDARRWRYVRLVLPFALEARAQRQEFVDVTIRLRRAGPEAFGLDLEPPLPIGPGGLPAVLGAVPIPLNLPAAPGEPVLAGSIAVEVNGYGSDSVGWSLRDADGGPLADGSYVVAAVLRMPPTATTVSGELSALASLRWPYLGSMQLSRPRTRYPEQFSTPIILLEADGTPTSAATVPNRTGPSAIGTGTTRLCLAADAEAYSSRDVHGQLALQRRFVEVLDTAAQYAGLDRGLWQWQEQGDGQLVLLPLGLDEPRAVADLLRELAVALRHLNRDLRDDARLRLRLAIHTGLVYPAHNGYAGDAVIHVSRLLDSAPLRTALREAAGADLAVAVSAVVYDEIVRHEPRDLRANRFRPVTVEIPSKKFRADAWIAVADEYA
ncbi:hypothetical protein AB0J90_10895 [Micromonospora sp. NPDC049523]|uniref:hypothetical protein n=1 Tax=Micromonospora sp. NPDC049523 TaxID=3155921 RepID=UPI003442844F